VAAADALASRNSSTGLAKVAPVERHRHAFLEAHADLSAFTATSSRQKATPMIGLTMRMPLLRNSRSLASCVAPSMLESVL
jgi:hypothetical protein